MIELQEIAGIIGDPKLAELHIVERTAESLVSHSIYDENGVIIGQVPDEAYEIAMEQSRGKVCFEARAIVDGKTVGFRSAIVDPEHRGGAMAEMFAYFGSSLFTHLFNR